MKLIAIPDLHLDKRFNTTYGDPSIWSNVPLDLVKEILIKEKPDYLVFDNSHPSYHSIFKFLQVIENYSNCIVLSGNHDIPKTKKTSVMHYLEDYVRIIPPNNVVEVIKDYYAIGWCDTQEVFEKKLTKVIKSSKDSIIFLHAGYNQWDNEMDNVVTANILKLAKKNNIKLISGHEHTSNTKKDTLFHLGSIMPMNIGELGKKYYWTSDKGQVEIKHNVGSSKKDKVILTRDSSFEKQGDKPIYIKTTSSITVEDLKMENKELTMDVLQDFKKEAIKYGFDSTFLEEYFD